MLVQNLLEERETTIRRKNIALIVACVLLVALSVSLGTVLVTKKTATPEEIAAELSSGYSSKVERVPTEADR